MNTSGSVIGGTNHGVTNCNKGLLIANTGKGKGKTTAALGLLLRAWSYNMKVVMLQFLKSSIANYGEHRAALRFEEGLRQTAGQSAEEMLANG